MKEIKIRKVTMNDIKLLQEIGRQTFYEAFLKGNTEENIAKYLEDGFSDAKLTAEFNNEHSVFYFAFIDDKVVGYLKLNFGSSQTELQDSSSLEIERIYVLQVYHGKKVGQILYEKAMWVAENEKVNYVWLGVWEENLRAIHFYQKNGFIEFDKHIFRLGNDEQIDIMMKKVLNNNIVKFGI